MGMLQVGSLPNTQYGRLIKSISSKLTPDFNTSRVYGAVACGNPDQGGGTYEPSDFCKIDGELL